MRPVKVEREQLSFCSWKPGEVGSQVVFTHLLSIFVSDKQILILT